MIKPVSIPLDAKFVQDAAYYAYITVFDSFKQGFRPRFGNGGLVKHMLGKIGELAFFRFCLENGIAVKHTPFRNDYSKLNGQDDFVVSIMGIDKVVEVKTQTIKNLLEPDEMLKLFYNKAQFDQKPDRDFIVVFAGVNPQVTQVALLGWIHAEKIAKAFINDKLKSPAYAIPISWLKPMEMFLEVR